MCVFGKLENIRFVIIVKDIFIWAMVRWYADIIAVFIRCTVRISYHQWFRSIRRTASFFSTLGFQNWFAARTLLQTDCDTFSIRFFTQTFVFTTNKHFTFLQLLFLVFFFLLLFLFIFPVVFFHSFQNIFGCHWSMNWGYPLILGFFGLYFVVMKYRGYLAWI